jgi:hypothetical protein
MVIIKNQYRFIQFLAQRGKRNENYKRYVGESKISTSNNRQLHFHLLNRDGGKS